MISKLRKSCLVLRCSLPNTTHAQFLNKLTSMGGLCTPPNTEFNKDTNGKIENFKD